METGLKIVSYQILQLDFLTQYFQILFHSVPMFMLCITVKNTLNTTYLKVKTQ